MKHIEPVNEQIVAVIYKKITGQIPDAGEENMVKKWMQSSIYYRALMEDIDTDQHLKNKLLSAYTGDKDECWKIIITYRAALHNGMALKRGNFWQRLFRLK